MEKRTSGPWELLGEASLSAVEGAQSPAQPSRAARSQIQQAGILWISTACLKPALNQSCRAFLRAKGAAWSSKPQLGTEILLFSRPAASKTLPSPAPPVLSRELGPGDLRGWILVQGKRGGGKAEKREASQDSSSAKGSRGGTGTAVPARPRAGAPAVLTSAPAVQHIWPQAWGQGAGAGHGSVPARAQLSLCCHKSTESSTGTSWRQREAAELVPFR